MLIIEDAHWADSATLSLLRHLARRLRRVRVLIIATHREAALDETRLFQEWLGDLRRENLATALQLVRLTREHTHDLLAAIFREAITPDFLDGIYHATEGNPFFVTEVCRALIDEGTVYREGERWQRLSMAQIQIPPSVRLAIRRRVDRLPEAAQDALQRAAVIGREFSFDVLRTMSDLSEDALSDALELAQRAQLIDEVPRASWAAPLSFAFGHALIQTTLHEDMHSLRRQRLHKRVAQALERIHADRLDELAAPLGRHYAEAGESEKAIAYLLRAGDQARSVCAYGEAIEHYRQALAFLKERGVDELVRAARTAMHLGGLYHSVLNFEQAQQSYDEAFDLWQRAHEVPAPALPPAPHALRCYWEDIQTLDLTLINYYSSGGGIAEQLFSGLVELTLDFDVVPMLARRWEILDGGRRYVFHLRRDARWSDGQSVTAHDFDCAWRRTLDPATHSTNAEYLYPIKNARAVHHGEASLDSLGIRLPDDFTLAVELEEPTGYFLQLLTYAATF
ncbi:MAG TPA: ABC transporter substrate-binding protein, partial [Burkholderiales bacterium]|nr:ABC transporter substrate-binding protein [Burkholderiales bacterium]